jgi:hypothetical protein
LITEFWRGLAPGWKLACSLAVLTVAIFALLMTARFQFRADAGVYSFSFGRPLPVAVPAKDSTVQIQALRVELTRLLEARSQAERAEWMNVVRREIKQSSQHDNRQRQQWNAALASLESRLNDRIEESAVTLTAGIAQSSSNVFQACNARQRPTLTAQLEHLATRETERPGNG